MKEFKFRSSRDAGLEYTTILHDTGVITCNCPGYTRRSVRECKHTKAVAAELGLESFPPQGTTAVMHGQVNLFSDPEGFIDPMLAMAPDKLTLEDMMNDDYIMEEKFDGHRLIVRVDGTGVFAWSRQGNVRRLSSGLMSSLRGLPDGTYDGELIIPGGTSTDVVALDKVQNAQYIMFDQLNVGSNDITKLPLKQRRQALVRSFGSMDFFSTDLSIAMQLPVARFLLEKIWLMGGEGVIVKNINGEYEVGRRSRSWLKFKRFINTVFVLIGFEEGLLGPHSKMVLRDEDGMAITVKTKNDAWRAAFAVDCERYFGCAVNVEHQGRTREGKYRSPMVDHFPNGELK